MRKRRDGDDYIEMKRGDPSEYGAALSTSTGTGSASTAGSQSIGMMSQSEDVPEASFSQLSTAVQETVQETVPKQVAMIA